MMDAAAINRLFFFKKRRIPVIAMAQVVKIFLISADQLMNLARGRSCYLWLWHEGGANPRPASHSTLSRETMAMPAPRVLVSFKTASMAACNSEMEPGPRGRSAANALQQAVINNKNAVATCFIRKV